MASSPDRRLPEELSPGNPGVPGHRQALHQNIQGQDEVWGGARRTLLKALRNQEGGVAPSAQQPTPTLPLCVWCFRGSLFVLGLNKCSWPSPSLLPECPSPFPPHHAWLPRLCPVPGRPLSTKRSGNPGPESSTGLSPCQGPSRSPRTPELGLLSDFQGWWRLEGPRLQALGPPGQRI